MKRINLVIVAVLFQATVSMAGSCRDEVVEAYTALDSSIERDSFSSAKFIDLDVGIEEFNNMNTEDQEEIYIKIRPMRVMVETTILNLNRQINRYAGTFYEMYVLDKLEIWRESVENLKSCYYEVN